MNLTRLLILVPLSLFTATGCSLWSASNSAAPGLIAARVERQAEPPASQAVRRVAERRADVTPRERLIAAGVEQTAYTTSYDPAYVKLAYPGGDVARETGVCADVIVRAFRACGVDLQKEVHEDMARSFAAYPQLWRARGPDANIDHRRVANLMKWFERRGKALGVSDRAEDYAPGDVVAWDLGNGRLHIGLVTDVKTGGGDDSPHGLAVVHNISAGAQLEPVLFAWKVIGRYRYFDEAARPRAATSPDTTPNPSRTRRRS
jgi:uncharacterized protein